MMYVNEIRNKSLIRRVHAARNVIAITDITGSNFGTSTYDIYSVHYCAIFNGHGLRISFFFGESV